MSGRGFKPDRAARPGVTDRPSDTDPPRPVDVRRSLRALADGSAPPRDPPDGPPATDVTPTPHPQRIVTDAERAAACAREAATFLSAGTLADLDRAVATAARRGDDDIAARGRAARGSLRRLDAALSESTPEPASDNHFGSGRGTVLGDTAQRSGR
jgi:hypothetical protein